MDGLTTPIAAGTKVATKDLGVAGHASLNALVDQTGADVIGLVDPAPSPNTVLGRLKAIADAVTTLSGYVDGLEGLATSLNGFVDGLETVGAGTNTRLDAIAGYLDTVEALIAATNTALGGTLTVTGPLTSAQLTTAALATEATLAALSGKLPASLGAKAASGSLSIVPATSALFPVTQEALPAGTNVSGTITTGGTAQVLAAANAARKALYGQNISAGDLWINETGGNAAVGAAGSYKVAAGESFSVNTNRAISIIGATTGQAFTATEL